MDIACSCCGRTWTWTEYLALPFACAGGDGRIEIDDDVYAEMRNCPCGATMARTEPQTLTVVEVTRG